MSYKIKKSIAIMSHLSDVQEMISFGKTKDESLTNFANLRINFVKMLILDESVSAVDVSIQAQILTLLRELQEKLNLTYLFISHDLSIVRYMSHKIAVLYQGEIAEFGTRENLFSNPVHPYTHTLMNSIPDPFHEKSGKVSEIGTGDESIDKVSTGCSFRSRCAIGAQKEICMSINPGLTPNTSAHELVACHFPTTSSEYAQALKSLTQSAG